MTFFLKAAKTFGLTGSPGSLSFWAGSVLAVAGFCGLFAVARRSAGGVVRKMLERHGVAELELPALQMETSFDSVDKPLVIRSDSVDLTPRDHPPRMYSRESAGLRRSWTGRMIAMAKGAIFDWRGKDRDIIME